MEESLALLRSLEAQGVDTVVLTPHYYGRQKGVRQFLEKRAEAYAALRAAYTGNIRLLLGCECNIATCANGDVNDLIPLALEGTGYILTELSFDPHMDERIFLRLRELTETAGLVPVIAHVELYPAVQRQPELAARLIAEGCLLQVNCESVVGAEKKSLAQALVLHGQAHCLGSDTHNTKNRPPLYRKAVERLNAWADGAGERMQENMRKVLRNEPLGVPAGEPVRKKLLGYV